MMGRTDHLPTLLEMMVTDPLTHLHTVSNGGRLTHLPTNTTFLEWRSTTTFPHLPLQNLGNIW